MICASTNWCWLSGAQKLRQATAGKVLARLLRLSAKLERRNAGGSSSPVPYTAPKLQGPVFGVARSARRYLAGDRWRVVMSILGKETACANQVRRHFEFDDVGDASVVSLGLEASVFYLVGKGPVDFDDSALIRSAAGRYFQLPYETSSNRRKHALAPVLSLGTCRGTDTLTCRILRGGGGRIFLDGRVGGFARSLGS